MHTMQLILASTSHYRRELLTRFGLPFACVAPAVDESAHPDELPAALCARLSEAKASAVAARHPQALVIGSDQVAERAGILIGKPGSRESSRHQLAAASGNTVRFHTGICMMHADSTQHLHHIDVTEVRFRVLNAAMIENYLDREQALDCAGGFKCEGLGVALFDAIRTDDPTALIGLPLIALRRMLGAFGIDPLL